MIESLMRDCTHVHPHEYKKNRKMNESIGNVANRIKTLYSVYIDTAKKILCVYISELGSRLG